MEGKMHPILIKLGPITIHTYGFLLALGVIAAILLSLHLAKKQDINRRVLTDFFFYTILMGLLGAKLFLFITEFGYYSKHPGQIKNLITSAGTFYGGLIFGVLFAIWFVRKHHLDFKVVGDIVGPALALAHFFGRLGCFSAGCCYGREAPNCAIAIEFTDSRATTGVPQYTPLYPTQLMEAILNFLNFIVLLTLYRRRKFDGQIFVLYIFNYSIIRFFVEFFRGDADRGYVFGSMDHPFSSLSVPQLLSIIGFITAIILYRVFKKKSLVTNQPKKETKRKK
jgi:phosphatidylglycerol:prolipoprotein diacylglycerol transferase